MTSTRRPAGESCSLGAMTERSTEPSLLTRREVLVKTGAAVTWIMASACSSPEDSDGSTKAENDAKNSDGEAPLDSSTSGNDRGAAADAGGHTDGGSKSVDAQNATDAGGHTDSGSKSVDALDATDVSVTDVSVTDVSGADDAATLDASTGVDASTKTDVTTGADAGLAADTNTAGDVSTKTDTGSAVDSGASSATDATSVADAGSADALGTPDAVTATDAGPQLPNWANGGTKSIKGTYPNPFTKPATAPCELTCQQALGPCFVETVQRTDVTEGEAGLPMVLRLRIVDKACKPIPGAIVDIWHTDRHGVYSGKTPDAMCNNNDPKYVKVQRMRGWQKADANGVVTFHTIYPSWYPGRAIHIHFTIEIGKKEVVTSQLYFDDATSEQLFKNHVDYKHRPNMDTSNAADGMTGKALAKLQVNTQLHADGVMLGHKTIVVRSNLADPLCWG